VIVFILPFATSCQKIEENKNELFGEGLVSVKIDGKWGYMNKDERLVIKAIYDEAYKFSCGLACVAVDGKFGYINTDGEMVIEPQFDGAATFSEDIAVVYVDKSYVYINKKGEFIWIYYIKTIQLKLIRK
jgi:hypothetical protein